MATLTDLKVKKAKPGRHGDGDGLYLLVKKTGARSWVLRVVVQSVRKDIGLGAYPLYSLSEIRERAREIRKVAKEGGDPTAFRDKAKTRIPTFEEAAKDCHAAKKSGWSEKSAKAFLSSLELHVFPVIGSGRVDSIGADDVAKAIVPTWVDKPSVGVKLRHRIGLVLDFAKAKRWRTDPTPRESLSVLLPKRGKGGSFSSMPYQDAPDYVAGLASASETLGRMALLFTIYTAARSGETREAQWVHIDLDAGLWNRPAALMRKTGEDHTVTLNPPAIDILRRVRELYPSDELVFPSNRGGMLSDMTLSKILRPTGYHVHGFRATFKTWAVERMPAVPEAVSEAALAHVISDKVERAYNRAKFLDMRRTLLDAWGQYLVRSEASIITLPLAKAN